MQISDNKKVNEMKTDTHRLRFILIFPLAFSSVCEVSAVGWIGWEEGETRNNTHKSVS